MSETSRRWRPRFRLASLLWLMLCVALIGTYRWAYERGREEALAQRTFVGRMHNRVYYLQDVMPMPPPSASGGVVLDFDAAMQDLQKDVLPNTWEKNGGSATMAEFVTNISLVVSHDDDGHQRIADWMKRRRERLARQGTPTIGPSSIKQTPLSLRK
jgi:hypothetical protein